MPAGPIRPEHKAIREYYAALKTYASVAATHEGAVETAFQRLLADTGRSHGWTLIPKQSVKLGKKTIIPDGLLQDEYYLKRGYWEAKDTDDDLDDEIAKKIKKGYPLTNTIFEDTRTAVLFQNGKEINRFELKEPQKLADLLNDFYAHVEPEHENFENAVADFKERVPDLAKGLLEKIEAAHKSNKKFQTAFDGFFQLCQQTLNPNIAQAAVDEMLVQHLLTERLFRTIFQDPDFIRRNVIAAEVERVIDALVSQSFSRVDFLKSLDRFYRAIEAAAETLDDFTEKQHFLNTVYERFFQGYSVKVADTHGIVYTPQEIVDFMCASVAEVLQTEFGLTLGSKGVNILDPCTGTGNFIVNILRRIPKRDLPRMYKEQLFANEVMLLPYYIAALNIEHAYYEMTGQYEAFEGLCFVDSLDLAEEKPHLFSFTEKNTERVERQKKAPITVIVGNPPYNMGQINENDNNKNRKYKVIDKRIAETFGKDSKAQLKNKLYDVYVKFFRWGIDRLADRDGILCFVSNNSFADEITFDGMRKHLLGSFTRVYHIDLHGNVRRNPKLSGTTHNVFGIQVGVGVTIAVRLRKHKDKRLYFVRVPETWRKEQKLALLRKSESLTGVKWKNVKPDAQHTWRLSESAGEYAQFTPTSSDDNECIFELTSLGIATNRDEWQFDFSTDALQEKAKRQIQNYNYEVFRLADQIRPDVDIDSLVNSDPRFLKWTDRLKSALLAGKKLSFDKNAIRAALVRPFSSRRVYFDSLLVHRRYQQHHIFPNDRAEQENKAIAVSQIGFRAPIHSSLIVNRIPELHLCATTDGHQCFPFYVYDEDGSNRRENITDWALEQFRTRYEAPTPVSPTRKRGGEAGQPSLARPANKDKHRAITKWDIFHYVYGILHHPGYRTKFADNLKRELPRIPFAPDFWAFADAGRELARLHLDYEKLEPWPLTFVETDGVPLSYRVEKMKLSKDKTELRINPSLALRAIPPEVFEYRLGNRSALDWVIDQYQVSEDKRSGIKSDPNRDDDPEYIVRLVGQVVRVSVETERIVKGLPAKYAE